MPTTLIVLLIVIGGQVGPTIQGWNTMEACETAAEQVATNFKARQGAASYLDIKTHCISFANPAAK